MSSIYLVLLSGVGVVILAALFDALAAVSRRPDWGSHRPQLTLVPTTDRRDTNLPHVGTDRRAPHSTNADAGTERAAA